MYILVYDNKAVGMFGLIKNLNQNGHLKLKTFMNLFMSMWRKI